jgi:hypothetical protein
MRGTTPMKTTVVFSPTMHHSGSNSLRYILGGEVEKLRDERIKIRKGMTLAAHFRWNHPESVPLFRKYAERYKTVIPLRHPALIGVSHKKRNDDAHSIWVYEWMQMMQVPAFHFPIETMPFDELEAYLGRDVRRHTKPMKSIGDYPEKESLEAARDFLGDAWWTVEWCLNTDIGKKYYEAHQ